MRISSRSTANTIDAVAMTAVEEAPQGGLAPPPHAPAGRRVVWQPDGRVPYSAPAPLWPVPQVKAAKYRPSPRDNMPVCLAHIAATQEYLYVERIRRADGRFTYSAYLGRPHHMRQLVVQSSTVMPVHVAGRTTMVTQLVTDAGTLDCGLPAEAMQASGEGNPCIAAHRCELRLNGQAPLVSASYGALYLKHMRKSLVQALGVPKHGGLRGHFDRALRPVTTAFQTLAGHRREQAAAAASSQRADAAAGSSPRPIRRIALFDQVRITHQERAALRPEGHRLHPVQPLSGFYLVVALRRDRAILVDSRGERFAIDRKHPPLQTLRAPWRDGSASPAG